MPTIECPLCHSIDQAQRVTAIVGGETHDTRGGSTTIGSSQLEGRTDYYAGKGFDRERVGDGRISAGSMNYSTTSINVTQQSRLAKKLGPPSPPTEPPELNFPLSWGDTVASGLLAAIPTLVFWYWLIGLFNLDSFWGGLLCFIGTPILAIGFWSVIFMLLGRVNERMEYPEEKRQQLTQAHQAKVAEYGDKKHRWQVAMERWNAMFYCRRCDVVYVPDDTFAPVSPEDTIALAYARARSFASDSP